MQCTQTSHGERGFSLVELLVATAIVSSVMAAAGGLFAASRRFMQDQSLLVETQQGLRATLESMARDLRLGGACLPITGDFVVLDGTDSATTDSITTRTGLVRPSLSCVSSSLTSNLASTSNQITVANSSGFTVGMRALIRHATNGTGESFTVTAVPNATTIQKSGGWTQAYPINSSVYAVDERTYAIDTSNSALPVLTVASNGNPPMPFAYGIENLTIKYLLARNCASGCDIIDAPPPADDQWRIVNEILITATARSRTLARNGQYIRVTGRISAKPRNLLP